MERTITQTTDWTFWAGWGAAFLGFPAGGVVGMALLTGGGVTDVPRAIVGGAATGLVIGGVQWLALRRRLPLSPLWAVVTSVGMAAGLGLGVGGFGTGYDGVDLIVRGLLTGLVIGAAQFPVLMPWLSRASAWPIVVTLGWASGWIVTRAAGVHLEENFTVFGSTGAITFQALTGLVLGWMLRGNVRR